MSSAPCVCGSSTCERRFSRPLPPNKLANVVDARELDVPVLPDLGGSAGGVAPSLPTRELERLRGGRAGTSLLRPPGAGSTRSPLYAPSRKVG